MVDFPSLDPTTRRLPDVVRAQIATDLKDNAQVEGAAIAALFASNGSGKPSGGWAATDLQTAVQTSLNLANTAVQTATLPTADTLSGATTVGKALMKAADGPTAQAAIGAADATATAAALANRINFRGDYAASTVYAVNDVVNSPGAGRWRVIQAHTSAGPAPTSENPYWTIFGGNSSVVIGTTAGTAPDATTVVPTTRTINGKPLTGNVTLSPADTGALASGYAGAVAGTRFTVLWVSGTGWPATRPSSRMDIFFDWLDTTGESTDADIPSAIINGDTISRFTATGTVTTVAFRSSSVIGPNQSINYLATPLQLPAPAGMVLGDYYMVAVLFGSIAAAAGFIAPSGFGRLTPVGSAGQLFAVYGYKMATSADLSAVATSNWSPNSSQATRGQAIGVALEGVASVGTPTAITYTNPITSPFTPTTVTGDATFQVMYTGNTSTSSHPVHASVGGTLLAQVMAETGTPDPQSDNVLSISMNGTGVSWSPAAIYGGGTNIPVTKG